MRIAYSARAKPLELKRSAHPSMFPGAPWYFYFYFFSGALQLALEGKLGQDSSGGKKLVSAALCIVTCEPWAELCHALIDSRLPRVITP